MKNLLRITGVLFLYLCATTAYADPPIWDPVFGTEVTSLTLCDDCNSQDDGGPPALLGFNFPFAGGFYNSISINNNGGVALGNDDIVTGDPYVDYDIWNVAYFESDFTAGGNPSILPFNTDLDNDCCGDVPRVYFKTDGTKATITWVDVGTNQNDGATDPTFATFQLIMEDNGTITFGYNGIGVGLNMITDLDQGIVVGVSDGTGAVPPGSSDLSAGSDSGTNPNMYETWCFDVSPNVECFEPNQPTNAAFDLDQSNLVFTPNGNGGFTVSANGTPIIVGSSNGGCSISGKGAFDPT